MLFFLFMLSITSFMDIAPLLRPGGGSKTGKIEREGPKFIASGPSVPFEAAAVDGAAAAGGGG